jgi:pimeloyl-ACP methyl ester carboxylesterase
VIVLLHGFMDSPRTWDLMRPYLGEREVLAPALPGHLGGPPLRGDFDLAGHLERVLDEAGVERAHLVGNSLGGRVAIEVGLRDPGRVQSLSLLCPSMAWRRRRTFVPIVRLLRPEWAAIPHSFGGGLVRQQFWSMFSRPERIHPSAADVAVEEFLRTYRSVNARVAFHAAARHIYLEEPNGSRGFYTRLRELEPPAMFVWGDEDPLVPLAFSRYVSDALPDARQVVIDQCGHVPQVEHPVDANSLVHDFIGRAQASARERAAKRLGRAARRLQDRINGNGSVPGGVRSGNDPEIAADAA